MYLKYMIMRLGLHKCVPEVYDHEIWIAEVCEVYDHEVRIAQVCT